MTLLMNSIRFILPVLILGGMAIFAKQILDSPPEAERSSKRIGPLMQVEVMQLKRQPYRINIQSYGILQPQTQSMLISQVSGQVISINPSLREGGFFEKGDELLKIDPRDFVADVKIAEASLMDAKQSLAEEKARSEQALRDWNRLGNKGEPSDLVLRKPQYLAAEARVISSASALTKARLNLERTRIIAPYAGRVMNKMVDVGQVVLPNSNLAEIYASEFIEVRLPLRNRDLAFIQLPESFRFDADNKPQGPEVIIHSELAMGESWHGRIVRTESTIDDVARQLHVVAQIDNPFDKNANGKIPLKIGQYVTAEIRGNLVEDALVIPNRAIYQGSYVYISDNNILQRKDIKIAWQNDKYALIEEGLEAGEQLVLTSLGQVTSGISVDVIQMGETNAVESAGHLSMQKQRGD